MNQLLKEIVKKAPLYFNLRDWVTKRMHEKEFTAWEKRGKPVPPPHFVSQQTLKTHAVRFGIKILVETGTYYGDMIEAMRGAFEHIYSIELSEELHKKAQARFKGVKQIELICGDSAIELKNLMNKIEEPALFWLDGHYSGGVTAKGAKETPIFDELRHILTAPDRGHVIIIDDARFFGTDSAFPSIDELKDFIKSMRQNLDIAVQDDSIRITPSQETYDQAPYR